jgi:hypothetical protein
VPFRKQRNMPLKGDELSGAVGVAPSWVWFDCSLCKADYRTSACHRRHRWTRY